MSLTKKLLEISTYLEELDELNSSEIYINEDSSKKFWENQFLSIEILLKKLVFNYDELVPYTKESLKKMVYLLNERIDNYKKINFLFGNGVSISSGSKSTQQNFFNEWLDKKIKSKEWKDFNVKIKNDSFLKEFINKLKDSSKNNSNIEIVFNNIIISMEYLNLNMQNNELYLEIYKFLNSQLFLGDSSLLNEWLNFAIGDIIYDDYNLKSMIFFIRNLFNLEKNDINIFTLNYDLIIETICDKFELNLNTGFRGVNKKRFNIFEFDTDKYYRRSDNKIEKIKKINLFKLHGSINWYIDNLDNSIFENQLTLENHKLDKKLLKPFLIMPTRNKLSDSLNVPFGELQRKFKESISIESNLLIIIGYSGGDSHINQFIEDSLKSNSSLEIIIFIFSEKKQDENKWFDNLEKLVKQSSKITIIYSPVISDFSFISWNMMRGINAKKIIETYPKKFEGENPENKKEIVAKNVEDVKDNEKNE